MPDWTATHPGRHHSPAIPSNLRNEITADHSDSDTSAIQVPDSQVCVPATQYDLHSEDWPGDCEHHREPIGRQQSERPNEEGPGFQYSRQFPQKNTATVDFTFGATQLAKPKPTEVLVFSPFFKPNPVVKSTRKVSLTPSLDPAVIAPEQSSPALHNTASQAVGGTTTSDHSKRDTFLKLSVVQQTDDQDDQENNCLPVVGNHLIPPTIGMNCASNAIPSIAAHESPNQEVITKRLPPQQDHLAEIIRPERRPKGKKPKKGRKPKLQRPDTAVAWPPKSQYTADKGYSALGNDRTEHNRDRSRLHKSEAPASTYDPGQLVQLHPVHHPEAIPVGLPDEFNIDLARSQDGRSLMGSVEDLETTPGPTPAIQNNHTDSQAESYVSSVLPVQMCNEADGLESYNLRCIESSQVIISGHDENEDDSLLHETHDHGSPRPVLNDHGTNRETYKTTNGGHDLEYRAPDLSQTEGFAIHTGVPQFEDQTGEVRAHIGSSHSRHPQDFQDSVLHAKSGQDSSDRVRKLRSKRRAKGPSALPALRATKNEAAISNSPDHEVILNMMAMCLRAGDNKARNIVDANAKAQEAAIASLQETIVQQNCFIQNLQAQNENLQGREQTISDSATRLQKYVKGMEGDYSRLKGQTEAHRKICDKLVKDAIHSLEQEKSALKHEFLQTVEVLGTSQRHMRAAMNDCFSQLMLSESKYRSASKQLQKLTADYDEEKKLRSNLEQQILPTVQAIQISVDENQRVILEKASNVQGAMGDNSPEQQERDTHLRECLEALRSFRSAPILTVNDFRKAEGILQFIHESMSSKMTLITQTMEKIQDPTEDIQTYIRNQLSILRADVFKYEEVFEDCRKAQQSNEQLRQRLETQKEEYARLQESMRSSQQEAADVKAQYSSLQSELENWKGKACNHEADPSEVENEKRSLRKQLEKAGEDLRKELTELGRLQQRLEGQTKELTNVKITLKEKDAAYQEDIRRLKQESDGKDGLLQELRTERDKLTGDLSLVESKLSEMASETEKLRESDNETRKELQKARLAAKEASSVTSELTKLRSQVEDKSKETATLSSQLASLKQQMAQKSAVHRSQEEDLERIQADHTRLVKKTASLAQEKEQLRNQADERASTISTLKEEIHTSYKNKEKDATSLKQLQSITDAMQKEKDQLTSQMSVDRSTMEEIRKELDARNNTLRTNTDALIELQRRVEQMQIEKQELAANLGRSRAKESKLSEAQAVYSSEKEGMQLEIARLQASCEGKDNELRHAQADAMEKSQTVAEIHSAESDDLKRRIGKIEIDLKAAEKVAEHKTRELEAHKKATLEKYQKLVLEARRTESARGLEPSEESGNEALVWDSRLRVPAPMYASDSKLQRSHFMTESVACDEESFDATVAKARKKPLRLNTTVLNVAEGSRSQAMLRLRLPNPVIERLHEQNEDENETSIVSAHGTHELGAREVLDEHGVSFIPPAAEESQVPQSPFEFSVGDFIDSPKAMSESRRLETSSSVLSEPPSSDDLIDMGPLEKRTVKDSSENVYGYFGAGEVPRDIRYHETAQNLSRSSLHESPSIAQERPKSQANTRSRMLPPPTPTGSSTRDYPPSTKAVRRGPSRNARSGRVGSGNARSDSPDFLRRPTSSLETYGNHSITSAGLGTDAASDTPRESGKNPKMKRKGPASRAPDIISSKRRRSSSRLGSSQSISSSQPAQISQPQSQAPHVVPTPRGRRSKGKRNDEFDAMFDRELQSGRSHRMR